jgi:hypothetical protein
MFSEDDFNKVRQFYEARILNIPVASRLPRILKEGINYPAIKRRIDLIIQDCLNKNNTPLDTANILIHQLLNLSFFEYNNPVFSLYVGYAYLESMGLVHNAFSIDAITQVSSITDINTLTATW